MNIMSILQSLEHRIILILRFLRNPAIKSEDFSVGDKKHVDRPVKDAKFRWSLDEDETNDQFGLL